MMSRFQIYFRAIFLFAFVLGTGTAWADSAPHNDILLVSGSILNPQGNGVKDAELHFYRGDHPLATAEEVITNRSGNFETELHLPPGSLPGATVSFSVGRPSYKTVQSAVLEYVLPERVDGYHNHHYLSHVQLTLERAVSPAPWIAAAVLLAVYVFVAFELMHRTLAALVGASMLLFISYTFGTFDPSYRILTFDDAMHAIDGNVIFLLARRIFLVLRDLLRDQVSPVTPVRHQANRHPAPARFPLPTLRCAAMMGTFIYDCRKASAARL
jgi:hypothetical protein